MKIVSPVWYLNRHCPHCGQGDALSYVTCDGCSSTFLLCEETNEVLRELDAADARNEFHGECLTCGLEVRPVTGEEMQELGFRVEDYH